MSKKKSARTTAAKSQPTQIKITAAKGRPMLTWVGKRPLSHVTAFPAQRVEYHDALSIAGISRSDDDDEAEKRLEFLRGLSKQWNRDCWKDAPDYQLPVPEWGGLLFHGDNKEVLAHLLANGFRGKVNLIYIDPPFDSGADYVRKVSLRGPKGTAKFDGETYTLGEQIQYTDIWANDNYLQFMFERLMLLKELLAANGAIYLHCDPSRNSFLRLLLDEVFGPDAFVNEVIWQRLSAHNDSTRYGIVHDTVYYYAKGEKPTWHPQSTPLSERYIAQFFDTVEEATGRRYSRSDLTARGLRTGESGQPFRGIDPATKGNHWKVKVSTLEEWDQQGRIHWPKNGDGMPRLKRYLDEVEQTGTTPQDVWYDIKPIHNQSTEIVDYPTQKPLALAERIIATSTNPGDLVLDCFLGSGTTAAMAQKLGRRWIGCDINKGAIQTTVKRLRVIVAEQIDAARKANGNGRQKQLLDAGDEHVDESLKPAQFGFTTWRVNDYDLQIQHNEAVNLACEHIGVERTRSDSFFDGTRGQSLVKITPFGHPLTPLDLEELKRELESRPDEDRPLTLVCLGCELAARAWVEDWNRLRKGKHAVNKIEVIELRTDPKYGRFLAHQPATARIKVTRKADKLLIEVQDFVSPIILERLKDQAKLLAPKIDDWRAMVDCLYIDPAYDGQVFNVGLADIPERKTDLVTGKYTLPAPTGETTVAIKLVDMLGEEVLVTHQT